MGIHVIQSQRIDVLVHGVLSTLGQPAVHPLEVLKTQHFVVPTPAIEQWLTQKMAEEQGISANQLFHQRIRGFHGMPISRYWLIKIRSVKPIFRA